MTIPTYGTTLSAMLTANQVMPYIGNVTYFNLSTKNLTIYTGFNNTKYKNPLYDLYLTGLYMIMQSDMETSGLSTMQFDASGNY